MGQDSANSCHTSIASQPNDLTSYTSRVLTIHENAKLGFPNYYKLRGPVKERHIQVGNVIAVPVARALSSTCRRF